MYDLERCFEPAFVLILLHVCIAKISFCADTYTSNTGIPKVNAELHPHVQQLSCVLESQDCCEKQGFAVCSD